ncbi:IclR family transcriptional regulator [Microbacterium sp.]|uniref:IclR family transcriptional regulator n=1 Tax=Microbacterium sp. TaxID=51671 RepID=UPI002CD07DC2|nr:IclR family transcriptional regulator [Microbacterium sp.]HWL78306.1 IclR family transcriptional regulator [Microbacterium sp.]
MSVLDRILAVLDAVKTAGGPTTVSDITARTGIPKSTAARLVSDLVERGYLARDRNGITLGLRLFELGSLATQPRRLLSVAAPVVRDLSQHTGERVGLWVQQGTDMVSLAAVPGRLPMLPARAGVRSPALTTASGKAYLAFCEDPHIVERVAAPLHDGDADRFYDELTAVRSVSSATDPGQSYRGVLAVASPILGAEQRVVGAISIAGPADSMRAADVEPLVRGAAISLTRRLAAA